MKLNYRGNAYQILFLQQSLVKASSLVGLFWLSLILFSSSSVVCRLSHFPFTWTVECSVGFVSRWFISVIIAVLIKLWQHRAHASSFRLQLNWMSLHFSDFEVFISHPVIILFRWFPGTRRLFAAARPDLFPPNFTRVAASLSRPGLFFLNTHSHKEWANFDLSRSGPSSSPLAVDAAERKNKDRWDVRVEREGETERCR